MQGVIIVLGGGSTDDDGLPCERVEGTLRKTVAHAAQCHQQGRLRQQSRAPHTAAESTDEKRRDGEVGGLSLC